MNLNPFSSDYNKNPAEAAMPYLEKIPGTMKPYYDPYINEGKNALGTLMEQYMNLINNPMGQFNQIGQSFTESPGYQFQYNQALNAANSAAAAGGMLGTPAHQMEAASMAGGIANQDFYNYLSRALQQSQFGQQLGLGGLSDINQMGYGASNELANSLANNLTNQGNLQYAGTQQQNQANADMFNSLLGGITGLATGIGSFFIPQPKVQ